MMRLLPTFFLSLAICSSVHGKAAKDAFEISGAIVVDRIDPHHDSGISKAWSIFTSRKDEFHFVFYVLYMGNSQSLPKVGQVCDLKGNIGKVDELVGMESNRIERGRIVTQYECE